MYPKHLTFSYSILLNATGGATRFGAFYSIVILASSETLALAV